MRGAPADVVSECPVGPAPVAPASRRVTTNVLVNVAGHVAPLAIAYFAIPVLATGLGIERFGLLSIAWVAVGYFSVFDLGLGRALIKVVADAESGGSAEAVPSILWTALAALLALGVCGAAAAALATPWLVDDVLRVARPLRAEAVATFYILSASVPLVVLASGLRGVLELRHRFDLANVVRVPLAALTIGGPVLVLPLSASLTWITVLLLGSRVAATAGYWWLARRVERSLATAAHVDTSRLPALMRVGSWMTVSTLLSPLMVSADRVLLAALVGVGAVGYYTAPHEAITRLLVVPAALAGVLFPAFSGTFATDRARAVTLYERGLAGTFLLVAPVATAVFAFAPELLDAWLGPEFASRGAVALRWLAAGVLLNSLAQIPYALVQGAGQSDFTGKLHLAELPLYAVLAVWLIGAYGITGAAAAWTVRVACDAAALFVRAEGLAPARRAAVRTALGWSVFVVTTGLLLAHLPATLAARVALAAVALALAAAVGWQHALSERDRGALRSYGRLIAQRTTVAASERGR